MAIAGIIIQSGAAAEAVAHALRALDFIVDIQPADDAGTLAAVVETKASAMEDALKTVRALDGVLNLGLASVSYEDELTDTGRISCPAHKPRACCLRDQE